jgi:lipoprotein signal peptidase
MVILSAVVLDQVAKGALIYTLTGAVPIFGRAWDIIPFPYMMSQITNFFNLVFTWNPGTSCSLFRSVGEAAPLVIIALTGVVIGFLG